MLYLEDHLDYDEIVDTVSWQYLEVMEYTLDLFNEGIITRDEDGEFFINLEERPDTSKIDFDVIKLFLDEIQTEDFLDNYFIRRDNGEVQ